MIPDNVAKFIVLQRSAIYNNRDAIDGWKSDFIQFSSTVENAFEIVTRLEDQHYHSEDGSEPYDFYFEVRDLFGNKVQPPWMAEHRAMDEIPF